MRALVGLAAVVLLTAVLAGCSDNGDDDATGETVTCPASAYETSDIRIAGVGDDPIDDNHDNATVFESYNVRTCSLPAIGWSALSPDGVPHQYIGEIDMRGDLDLGAVAVLGNQEDSRVYVLDITNRSAPVVLAVIDQVGVFITDVKFSDDGNVLYTASQTLLGPEYVTSIPDANAPGGFSVYDIQDPSAPDLIGIAHDDVSGGCHMLDPVQVDPITDAVMCVSQHVRSYLIQRTPSPFANLGFVDYLPQNGPTPTPAGTLAGDPTCAAPVPVPLPVGCLLASGPHDMTAFHTGGSFGSGDSFLVVSHWDEGVKVLDITDAPLITEVGSWNGEGATHYSGNVHTAMMFMVGTERYIVASPEYTSPGTVPGLWVLDANDLGNLQLVGEWYHPGMHDSQGLYLTTHQWQVAPTGPDVAPEDVRIYLTYNHAGIWVLDFSKMLAKDNQGAILGYNLARTELPDNHVSNAILSTWDVGVVDGYIYGSDRATGLWVFHYTGDELGDERLRGFA